MTLEIANLTIKIPLPQGGNVHASTKVDLKIAGGEVHALIGESGCGKSTIAQAISGLLPVKARIVGHVKYRGKNIIGRQHEYMGRHIALIPQSASTFLTPVRTLGAQLEETVNLLRGPLTPEQLMSEVELSAEALQLYPHEISGGMAQRAAVAFALAGAPDVIIADEPTASLDPDRKEGIFRLLRHIANRGAAVMLITHDISTLIDTNIADKLSVCYASRIVETGNAQKILSGQAQNLYTRDLLAALPRNGLHRMRGFPPELTDLPDEYTYEHRISKCGGLNAGFNC